MLTDTQEKLMFTILKEFKEDAATMTHYDLADTNESITAGLTADQWKEFLNEQPVQDWIQSELNIMQKTGLATIMRDIGDSHSVGQAQLVKAITDLQEKQTGKSGPAFIYTYVPLNENQKKAPNVQILDEDPFLKG